MGYESKLYIGQRTHFEHNKGRDYVKLIMVLDLCKMGDSRFYNSSELFDKKVNFDLYKEDGNHIYKKDRYGDFCYYTTIDRVIEALTDICKNKDYYRRADLALKALKAFKKKDWIWHDKDGSFADLVVMHYGY